MMRPQIGRRSWLRSLIAPGALFSLEAMRAKRTDAAQIGPKDNIKVTKIESFVLKSSWVFVKISTDAGIVG
jgi:galactonate dehydratase